MAELILCAVVVILLAIYGRSLTRQGLRTMLTVALLAGLASAGRAALASVPSVQPASFIIITAGILFGPGAGLVCGVITGFLSDLMIGWLWPYCAWHMPLWGIMGLAAGLLRRFSFRLHAVLGFIWGFVFGWCMNLWYYTTGAFPFSWGAYITACVSGVYFDLAHAVTNFVLLLFFAEPLRRLFERSGMVLKR